MVHDLGMVFGFSKHYLPGETKIPYKQV
jgi:hypothetical protein